MKPDFAPPRYRTKILTTQSHLSCCSFIAVSLTTSNSLPLNTLNLISVMEVLLFCYGTAWLIHMDRCLDIRRAITSFGSTDFFFNNVMTMKDFLNKRRLPVSKLTLMLDMTFEGLRIYFLFFWRKEFVVVEISIHIRDTVR